MTAAIGELEHELEALGKQHARVAQLAGQFSQEELTRLCYRHFAAAYDKHMEETGHSSMTSHSQGQTYALNLTRLRRMRMRRFSALTAFIAFPNQKKKVSQNQLSTDNDQNISR